MQVYIVPQDPRSVYFLFRQHENPEVAGKVKPFLNVVVILQCPEIKCKNIRTQALFICPVNSSSMNNSQAFSCKSTSLTENIHVTVRCDFAFHSRGTNLLFAFICRPLWFSQFLCKLCPFMPIIFFVIYIPPMHTCRGIVKGAVFEGQILDRDE